MYQEKYPQYAQLGAGSMAGQQTMPAGINIIGDVKRMAELPAALDNMERSANFLEELVRELDGRLSAVMRPPQPETAGNQAIGLAPPVSGYAATVHLQAHRITCTAQRIRDLLDRLEV